MKLIGFLVNTPENRPPSRDFTLFRIAAMDEVLRPLGARLFVYSPRRISPDSGRVDGFLIDDGRFVDANFPAPEVNGSWFIGRDKSAAPTMDAPQTRAWIARQGIDVYPLQSFSRILRDKLKTARLVRGLARGLHPKTEAFDGSQAQFERFMGRYRTIYVKPRFGSKGNDIFSVRRLRRGFRCTFYSTRQKRIARHKTAAETLAEINPVVNDRRFVIQQGVAIDRHEDAPFIFRVIMLDDGEQWQWVHKAVLAAPESEIANTTQGGSNWVITDLLGELYGPDRARELFEELRRVCFECIHHLDAMFPGKLMEVAFDFVLNKRQQVKILEINTLPGMTKPGLPREPAFADIFNRTAAEQELFEKFVLPHGACLARFLHTRLRDRQRKIPAETPSDNETPETTPEAGYSELDPSQYDVAIDREQPRLDQVIDRLGRHLVYSCLADGAIHPGEIRGVIARIDPRFGPLRQAEAVIALKDYGRWRADTGAGEAASRAAACLQSRFIAPLPDNERLLALWSRSEFNLRDRPDLVKLGWTALALQALASIEQPADGSVSLDQLRRLGEFLLWGQNTDGSFNSLLVPADHAWKAGWSALNYPGQAIRALVELHRLDPARRWVQAAADGIGFLVRSRESSADVPADYWALVATAALLPVYRDSEPTVSRGSVLRHARRICERILGERVRNPANPEAEGGFDADGRTEPTALRLRGLLAAQEFLADDDAAFGKRLALAIDDGIEFLVRACIADGSTVRAMPRAIRPLAVDGDADDAPSRRPAEVRIENVQHAIMAMIEYAQRRQESDAIAANLRPGREMS